ncbi:MAG: MGH1-like glycoside hydrolase domain-containing protein [Massiliimalia sp.]|jgi:putative isomerase
MKISEQSRKLYEELGTGFNTWDIQSVTAHVLLPERLRVNIGFFVPHINQYTSDNLWDRVEKFGEHTVDGSYTEVFIRFREGIYQVETTAVNDELLIRVTPVKPRYQMYLSLEVGELFGQSFQFQYKDDGVVATQGKKQFLIHSLCEKVQVDWDPVTCPHLIACADKTCYFTVNSNKTQEQIDQQLAIKKQEWLNTVISAEGDLGEGIGAMRRSLLWNMVYDFKNKRVITPVSRNWCKRGSDFGDYVLFGWDTFFAGLQYGLIDKRLAYSTIFSILEEVTPEGMIPNFGCGTGLSRDRSEPQVGAMCVWKLYVQYRDKWFLKECFKPLLKWNEWRFQRRDFNQDGLLELASEPWDYAPTEEIWNYIECGEKQGAMWESGIDNSTMWDEVKFNSEHHCLELSYVGLNALMVADCEFLEKIAGELGEFEEEEKIRVRRTQLTQKIEMELWDESIGCYRNKNWDGSFNPCMSLTHFYTITAGLGENGRLEEMMEKHLLNPKEFWGEYVIPNISRSDPSFGDQDYWRGRIWAPTNFIVNEGIVRIQRKDIWDQLVHKGFDLFMKCWNSRGVVGENYNAITGEAAEPDKSSDRFYHWGALLVYMAVQRAVNFNEWTDEIEHEVLPEWIGHIWNIPTGNEKIDV